MRADMDKVIVERPRKKGRAWRKPKGYLRRLRAYGGDGPPCREGIKACWQGRTKQLNEHLGPLRRYLDKQVGRPWNKVHSEICAHISRDNAVQDHVRDHVDGYVAVHVLVIDGVVCSGEPGWGYGLPLDRYRYRHWYVCPRTGLLRRVQRRRRVASPRSPEVPVVPIGKTMQCRHFDGAWHVVTLKPLPTSAVARLLCQDLDVLLDRPVAQITPEELRERYGNAVYAVAARRLARRELSQYPIPREWWTWRPSPSADARSG